MPTHALIDAAPDPVSIGIVAVVILLVIGVLVLLIAALVIFLWYRKRRLRHQDIGARPNNEQFPQR